MRQPAWKNPIWTAKFGYVLLVLISLFLLILGDHVNPQEKSIDLRQLQNLSSSLQKQDSTYDAALAKGRGLACEMEKYTSGASTWTAYSSLVTWGWIPDVFSPVFGSSLDDTLKSLNIDSSKNNLVKSLHGENVKVNNVIYEVSSIRIHDQSCSFQCSWISGS